MKIDGDATYIDKFGKRHLMEGEATLPDETELKILNVDGDIKFDRISCDKIKICGDCSGGSITAEKIFVDGDVKVDATIQVVDSLKVNGDCSAESLTANKIFIDGDVKADTIKGAESLDIVGDPQVGLIESKDVVINTRSGMIEEINCDNLKIFDNSVNFEGEISFGKFRLKSYPKENFSHIRVKKILAEKVELANCKVSLIQCRDAIIGENCSIEKLIVSGNLELNDKSKVDDIVRQ